MSHQDRHFSVGKVFGGLIGLTAAEIAWGLALHRQPHWLLWGGLLIFAFFKGLLIAAYFMHLKFEGWIVKCLILPTPFLILVIAGYVMSDISNGDDTNNLIHPIGSQLDSSTGMIDPAFQVWKKVEDEHAAANGQPAPSGEKH